jgi:hypothetical protein
MAVPWLVVGQLVLGNLDKIIDVVRPAFTRRKAESPSQLDLVNQQIAELQTAAANNAEQTAALARHLNEMIAALELAGQEAAAQRARLRRLAIIATAVAVLALLVAIAALTLR